MILATAAALITDDLENHSSKCTSHCSSLYGAGRERASFGLVHLYSHFRPNRHPAAASTSSQSAAATATKTVYLYGCWRRTRHFAGPCPKWTRVLGRKSNSAPHFS